MYGNAGRTIYGWTRAVRCGTLSTISGRPPGGVAPDGVGHGGGASRAGRPAPHPAAARVRAHRVQGARRLPARHGLAGPGPRAQRAPAPLVALRPPRHSCVRYSSASGDRATDARALSSLT